MTEECRCKKCQHVAKDVHRAWRTAVAVKHKLCAPGDIEKFITESWHEYVRHYRRVEVLVPNRARGAALHNTAETSALRQLREWIDLEGEFGDGYDRSGGNGGPAERSMVVLSGRPGTGKTVAAAWAVLHRLAESNQVLFLGAPELSRRRLSAELEEANTGTCVVVDDLGAEASDRRFVALFDEIVNTCYQAESTLIITTNCSAAEFQKRYGPRVVDRFAEAGTWISVAGKSMRGAA